VLKADNRILRLAKGVADERPTATPCQVERERAVRQTETRVVLSGKHLLYPETTLQGLGV